DATLYGAIYAQGLGQIGGANTNPDKKAQANNIKTGKDGLVKSLVSANASVNYNQSKYESNTSGTNSVEGNINVGKNFILQSNGDVTLINQKINVGENFVVDVNNFIVKAGENTYKNNTKSSSTGAN